MAHHDKGIQTGIQVLPGKVPHTKTDAYVIYDKFAPRKQ